MPLILVLQFDRTFAGMCLKHVTSLIKAIDPFCAKRTRNKNYIHN